ncbi:MAG TPA: LPS export ABC transporter periplasmic protein LptC [Stellaceae bacterium]|jgi:lipopolysaccharide export system protein LptC
MKVLDPGADFARSPPTPPSGRRTAQSSYRGGADSYSRAVGWLKRVLPMIGTALLLLVAAWPRLAPLIESVRLNAFGIDLRAARELKMLNPRYAGTDRLNRPFVVTAAVGRQLPERNDLMSLEKPRAVMIAHGGAHIVLIAASAIYQSQPQLLDLFDNVILTHQNGTRFVTQQAHADLAHNTAEGQVPIEGHGPSGDIWGQGFRELDKGDTIIFTGRSHAILRGTKPAKPAAAPPEPPTNVLRTAAAIEIAATTPDDRQSNRPLTATRAQAVKRPIEPHYPEAVRHDTVSRVSKPQAAGAGATGEVEHDAD